MCQNNFASDCPNLQKIKELERRVDEFEKFFWKNYVWPGCAYNEQDFLCTNKENEALPTEKCNKCSAGLAPMCDRDHCPVFRTKY